MKLKFCPECKRTEIEDITETSHGKLLYQYGTPRLFRCKKCDFTNTLFPEKEVKLKSKFNPALMKFEPDLEELSVNKIKSSKKK